MAEPESGSRSLSSRVGAEVETVGVLPVPDGQRTMRPFRVFVVWLMAASSATTPLIGELLGRRTSWRPRRASWSH